MQNFDDDNKVVASEQLDNEDIDAITHWGMPRRSGRYPWGSGGADAAGKTSFSRATDFLDYITIQKSRGLSDGDIAKGLGMKNSDYAKEISLAKGERKSQNITAAESLKKKGFSNPQIAKKLGLANESSVRSLLDEGSKAKNAEIKNTIDFLKERVDQDGIIDIGKGSNHYLNISKDRMDMAAYAITKFYDKKVTVTDPVTGKTTTEYKPYFISGGNMPQVTNKGKNTVVRGLMAPDKQHKDLYKFDNIKPLVDYTSLDGGETFVKKESKFIPKYPKSLDSKRVAIRYAEDGGTKRDGLIELRRGVDDISLGETSKYSQVRILVDGKKYLKGMAVYSDDLPDGIDVRFNTNKSKSVSKLDTMKDITDDPKNPFGALIRDNGQSEYTDSSGKKQMRVINKTRDEGDWGEWSKELPSQFLAKQDIKLINKQLDLSITKKQHELDEIKRIENPAVKIALLNKYALSADSNAVDLKAASLPGQRYQVLMPIPSMKDNEVYAPNFKDGSKIALVRYPHAGTFEIPILTVNNKNKTAIKTFSKNPLDMVGVNSKNAEILSGADFDGDTVQVIPMSGKIKIKNSKPLTGLEGFDAKLEYHQVPGMKLMKRTELVKHKKTGEMVEKTVDNTQKQMGIISNLVMDMTLKNATTEELARATRHSMVVIDAAKHKLNYKKSEVDNRIKELKEKYQSTVDPVTGKVKSGGASTLLTRSKSEVTVDRYKGDPNIDPKTGKVSFTEAFTDRQRVKTLDTYVDYKTGEVKARTRKSTAMAEGGDAYDLSSGTPQENAYAKYANSLKGLANEARRVMVNTVTTTYSEKAAKTYAKEVESLNEKLVISEMNKPRERRAQAIANAEVQARVASNPSMTSEQVKKASQQALTEARVNVGAARNPIDITPKEWEAIQAGALRSSKVTTIVNSANLDQVRNYATPKPSSTISSSAMNLMVAYKNSGNTNQQIAEALGIPVSRVIEELKNLT